MKSITVWVSKCSNPDSYEKVITYHLDQFINEVHIKLEEVVL